MDGFRTTESCSLECKQFTGYVRLLNGIPMWLAKSLNPSQEQPQFNVPPYLAKNPREGDTVLRPSTAECWRPRRLLPLSMEFSLLAASGLLERGWDRKYRAPKGWSEGRVPAGWTGQQFYPSILWPLAPKAFTTQPDMPSASAGRSPPAQRQKIGSSAPLPFPVTKKRSGKSYYYESKQHRQVPAAQS
jgi:hypothetical protein